MESRVISPQSIDVWNASSSLIEHHESNDNELCGQITNNPLHIIEIINEQETRNFKIGILLIFVAISTWIVGLELVNVVLKGDEYTKPFMFSFLVGSCFTLNLIPDIIFFLKSRLLIRANKLVNKSLQVHNSTMSPVIAVRSKSIEKVGEDALIKDMLTKKEVLTLAFQMSIIYTLYNSFVMLSLQFTSASNQTVLGTTTSIFTLFIGIYLKIDKFSIKKLICIFISTTGVFLINFSESGIEPDNDNKFQPKNSRLGNAFAIMGALMYAFYLILMKIKCGTGNRSTNERQLFGFIGVFTILLSGPILFLVDYLNIEKFEFPPPSNKILISIMINGVFSVISDYTTILAMLLTSPLVTSLSLTSAIPITIFIDYIISVITGSGSSNSNFIYFLGIISILVSVVLINVNITSENELIEEVVNDVIQEAIREDEVLSPVLSPLIGAKSGTPSAISSPYFQAEQTIHVGLNKSSLLASLTPSLSGQKKRAPLTTNVSNFNLNSTWEGEATPMFNSNHSNKLYHIDASSSDIDKANFIVLSGGKHHYQVKNIDGSNTPTQTVDHSIPNSTDQQN